MSNTNSERMSDQESLPVGPSPSYERAFQKMSNEEKLMEMHQEASLVGSTFKIMLSRFKRFETKIDELCEENQRQQQINDTLIESLQKTAEKEAVMQKVLGLALNFIKSNSKSDKQDMLPSMPLRSPRDTEQLPLTNLKLYNNVKTLHSSLSDQVMKLNQSYNKLEKQISSNSMLGAQPDDNQGELEQLQAIVRKQTVG